MNLTEEQKKEVSQKIFDSIRNLTAAVEYSTQTRDHSRSVFDSQISCIECYLQCSKYIIEDCLKIINKSKGDKNETT